MARLDDLTRAIAALYSKKQGDRDELWVRWLYPNHVLVVAEKAEALAKQKGANAELSRVAALLHDIADIKWRRANPEHAAESLRIARELMQQHGYTDQEVALVVDDAIRYHSCYDNERPKSTEGLVLATADSLAHLQTNFYIFAAWRFGGLGESFEEISAWVLKKIERDLNSKISFDDARDMVRSDYETIKRLFS